MDNVDLDCLPDYMFCPKCGLLLEPRCRHCPQCRTPSDSSPHGLWLIALIASGLALVVGLIFLMTSGSAGPDQDRWSILGLGLAGLGALGAMTAIGLYGGSSVAWQVWTFLLGLTLASGSMLNMLAVSADEELPTWLFMAYPVVMLVLLGFLWRCNSVGAYRLLAGMLVGITVLLGLAVILTLHDDELSVIYLTASLTMIAASIVTALTYAPGYRWWHGIRRGWSGPIPNGG